MSDKSQGDSPAEKSTKNRRGHRLAIGALAVFVLVYYSDYLIGRTFIWEDAALSYYPTANYFSTAVVTGRFPFWQPGLLNGLPFYTDIQAAVCYPVTWLLVPFARGGLLPHLIYQWYIVLHILMGGVFMYVYLKHHRLAPLACLLGAAVFCFSGFAALHVIHIPMLQVYAWLPLQLLLVDQVVRTRKAKYYALLTGVILLSLFAGYPQTTLYDSCLLVAYWLYRRYRLLAEEPPRRALETVRQLGAECLRIGSLFASVLLLGAIQLVPTGEHWHLSTREQWDFQNKAEGSMPFRHLIQLVIPNFFGVTRDGRTGVPFWGDEKDPTPGAHAEYADGSRYWEFGAYGGQLAVLALAASAFHRRKFRNAPVCFFLVSSILAAWFMLGWYGGLSQILCNVAPGVSLFRGPSRMASVLDFCCAALVAFFVDAQTRSSALRLGKPLAVILAAYAIGWSCYLAWGAQIFPGLQRAARAAFAHQQIIISFLLFLGTGLCLLGIRPSVSGHLRVVSGATLVLLTCADLYHAYGVFHKGHTNPREYYYRNSWILSEHVDRARQVGPMRFVQFVDGKSAVFATDENVPLVLRGVETTQGYVDLVPRYTARFKQLTNQTALLDLQNVGMVLLRDSDAGQWVCLRRECLPRLGFYSRIKAYDSDDAILHDLDSGELNYHDTAAVGADELGFALPESSYGADAPRYDLQLLLNSPENYQIKYSVDSPGILFISESYYPGWEAIDIQGKPLQVVRTFTAFKGIVIPQAGRGELTVRFRPRSFLLGAGISTTTAILLGMLCVVLIRRERRTGAVPVSTSEPQRFVDRQTPTPVGAK